MKMRCDVRLKKKKVSIFDIVPLWYPFLRLPFPQEAEVDDEAICMCETIVHTLHIKKTAWLWNC